MPNDLRKKLEWSAKKRPGGGSVGQELLLRLQQSFVQENEEERDPMLRVFDALMDGMLRIIVPPPRLHWEKDPWLYRAFYYAVSSMFSRFRPEGTEPGQEKLSERWRSMIARANRPSDEIFKHITQSPEAMGNFAEENMSRMFLDPSLVRSVVSAIQAGGGKDARETASQYEDLDHVLAHARRIMKRHTDSSKP
jgi:hypothetical protein